MLPTLAGGGAAGADEKRERQRQRDGAAREGDAGAPGGGRRHAGGWWVVIVVLRGVRGPDAGAADVPANGAPAATGLTGVAPAPEAGGPGGRGTPACHNLSMQDVSHLPSLVTGLAFLLATVFGAVATRVNFCTMGAISDVVNFGDTRRLRMWLLAIAVAIAGAAALQVAGLVDLSKTLYTGNRVGWLSLLVGGFLFGFGMTLGSGCGSKTLIRVGGGNLKSLIVLVFFADFRLHDAEGSLRAVAHDGARSAALRCRGARREDVRPAVDPRRARRRRRGQAVVSVRVRRGDRRLGARQTASSARRRR